MKVKIIIHKSLELDADESKTLDEIMDKVEQWELDHVPHDKMFNEKQTEFAKEYINQFSNINNQLNES